MTESMPRLERLSVTRLSRDDRLTLRLLDWAVDEQLGVIRFDEARLPFNSDSGFDVEPIYLTDGASLKTPADLAAWLKLLSDMPAYYAVAIADARRGIATRFTQPQVTIEQVLVRARAAAAMPIDQDPLLGPIARSPLPQAARDTALQSAKQIILTKVRPAQDGFVVFLEKESLPAARPNLAVTSLPDGQRYYAWLVRRYTTTDLSPDAIFDLGTREVARIRGEMQAVMRDAHFDGDLKSFIAFLRRDPQFYATSREELLEKASRIAKEIDYQLPAHFAPLPRLTYGVLPVPAAIEEGYTTGTLLSRRRRARRSGQPDDQHVASQPAPAIRASRARAPRGRARPPCPDRAGAGGELSPAVPPRRLLLGIRRRLGALLGMARRGAGDVQDAL